jgi:hypothetical protein
MVIVASHIAVDLIGPARFNLFERRESHVQPSFGKDRA